MWQVLDQTILPGMAMLSATSGIAYTMNVDFGDHLPNVTGVHFSIPLQMALGSSVEVGFVLLPKTAFMAMHSTNQRSFRKEHFKGTLSHNSGAAICLKPMSDSSDLLMLHCLIVREGCS